MARPTFRPFPLTRGLLAAALAVTLALVPSTADAGFRLNITRPSGGGGNGNAAAGRAAYGRVLDARQDLWKAMYDARQRVDENGDLTRAERDADAARRRYIDVRRRALARAAGNPEYARLRREVFALEQRFPDIVSPDRDADDDDAPGDFGYATADYADAGPPDRYAAAHVLLEARNRLSKLRRKLVADDPDLLDSWYAMQDAEALAADLRADLQDTLGDDPGVRSARASLASARDALAAVGG